MNRMETCSESEKTSRVVVRVSRRMSPITRVIDPVGDGRYMAVIVLDPVDNTSGVSVLIVGSVAGGGCPPDW